MLFAPQIAQLLARPASPREHAPTAPRTHRGLRGLRLPHRSGRALAVGRLLQRRRRTRTGTKSVETAS